MRTGIEIFVTNGGKFRAIVRVPGQPEYQVTVGGKSWNRGVGEEYRGRILKKCSQLLDKLNTQLLTS